jgi:penicillin amidase
LTDISRRRRGLRLALVAVPLIVLTSAIAAGWWVRAGIRASLAQLDGERQLAGLSSSVTIERDALGVPTIRGNSRDDVARATGFLHGQERFFQMDLSRRRAAGELSALVGRVALAADREVRVHRFRAEAKQAVGLLSPRDRALLDAYTAGVNSGLAALGARPFEYLLLRQQPLPWRPEDTLLVVLSMFLTLQDADGSYEETLATMHDVLPPEMAAFMVSPGTEWDAPIEGERFEVPAVPGPEVYDLRARRAGKPAIDLERRQDVVGAAPFNRRVAPRDALALAGTLRPFVSPDALPRDGDAVVGSNNFAVAGSLTADGRALVANDMHLMVRVPNVWYRAVLEWPAAGGERARLMGVTLPGAPTLVTGSNGHIAWGFTNTYADWGDLILLDTDPAAPTRYRTPAGWAEFRKHDEVIEIAGEEPHRETVMWTIWGPVLQPDHQGRQRAYRWVAHSAERLAAGLTPLEDATSIEAAFAQANGAATPGQNLVLADRAGRIAWSIWGSIPNRVGFDGSLPSSWADGTRGWHGWTDPSAYPRVVDPPGGRLWTANQRVVGGEMLARLGDGSYEIGSRASIIRDRLQARQRFSAADLLAIQLDASARFIERWHDLLLQTLTPAAVAGHAERGQLRELVRTTWTGQASAESPAYRFTRMFREEVSRRVITFVLAECYEADARFSHLTMRRREGPIWKLVSEQPMHLLDPAYASWDDLLMAAVDDVLEEVAPDGELADRIWAEYNITAYRHPLSPSLPFIGRLLDMPRLPLPGDLYTPRLQWGANAASERMIVSPGHEDEGIFQMPTGQSGHPMSPFYANSHPAWVAGEASPFLPGPTEHTLRLHP